MKIGIKQMVMVFLGLFLLKIAVADPIRKEKDGRRPSSIQTQQRNLAPLVLSVK